MNETEITAMVSGFTKALPELVKRLKVAALEMFKPCQTEMTAKELEAVQVAFCLGGVWSIINQVNKTKSNE